MGAIQSRLDITNQTAFLHGNFKDISGTYEQNAAETVDVALYTVLGKVQQAVGDITAGTNTGNGTVTALALLGTAIIGDYSLVLTAALVADLFDPNGNIVAKGIALTDGDATVVKAGNIQFTVTDGGTAFVATDSFTMAIDAGSGYFKALESDAVDGSQFPAGIINESVLATAIAAGDVNILDIVIGSDGVVDQDKIVFHNGTDTLATVIGGKTIEDHFGDMGIYFKSTTDFQEHENA